MTRLRGWSSRRAATTGWAATRPGCASGSGSLRRCCAVRDCCSSMSRRAASTRAARERSRSSSASLPLRASRCCSRATRSASWRRCAPRTRCCETDAWCGTGRLASLRRRRRPRPTRWPRTTTQRALEIAARQRGCPDPACTQRWSRARGSTLRARRARARARRRAGHHPPPRAARQPAREHVLRAHLGRDAWTSSRRRSSPRRSSPAYDGDRHAPAARAPASPSRATAFRHAYGAELQKLSVQLTTRLLVLVAARRTVRVRGAAQDSERHPLRCPVRRLGPLVRLRDLARDPRLRRILGLSDHRRRARRRSVRRPRIATAPGRRSSPVPARARTCSRASCSPPARS